MKTFIYGSLPREAGAQSASWLTERQIFADAGIPGLDPFKPSGPVALLLQDRNPG